MKFSLNSNLEYEMTNIYYMNRKKWKNSCESISS